MRKASNTVDLPALFGPTSTFIPRKRIVKSLRDLKFRNLTFVNMILHGFKSFGELC